MGPRKCSEWLRRHQQDERGAETVEFAVVVVLLIMIVYGMVAVGLSLAARESINQAVSDGARFGIVQPLNGSGAVTTATETSADTQAANELGWLGLGTCGTSKVTCKTDASSPSTCPTSFTTGGPNMCVSATTAACPGNTTGGTQNCLTVRIDYYYQSAPTFPILPGFNLITPSDVSSSATMQVATPTVS